MGRQDFKRPLPLFRVGDLLAPVSDSGVLGMAEGFLNN